jgi:hypothetical protein
MSNKLNEIANCLLVSLEVSIATPARKAKASDLGLGKNGEEIPPEDLATLGAFRIFDPEETKPLFTLKRQAERALFEAGVKFGRMGVIIPPEAQQETIKVLEEIRKKFQARRTLIMSDFASKQETWFAKYPQWEEILRAKSAESRRDISTGIDFSYTACAIGYSPNGNLDGKVTGLHEQVIKDVSSEAKDLLENRFVGSERVSWRTVETIKNLREKVNNLSFLNRSLVTIVEMIDEVMNKFTAKTPWITQENGMMSIMGMLYVLADSDSIKRHAKKASGLPVQSDIADSDEDDAQESVHTAVTTPPMQMQGARAPVSFM